MFLHLDQKVLFTLTKRGFFTLAQRDLFTDTEGPLYTGTEGPLHTIIDVLGHKHFREIMFLHLDQRVLFTMTKSGLLKLAQRDRDLFTDIEGPLYTGIEGPLYTIIDV